MKIDADEKELLESFERGEWKSAKSSASELDGSIRILRATVVGVSRIRDTALPKSLRTIRRHPSFSASATSAARRRAGHCSGAAPSP